MDSFSSAGGVIVDDFDNDGQLEILTSNFDSCGPMQLFQRGPRRHVRRAGARRPAWRDQLGGLNLLQTDYNNDGCRDVLVLRGGWELAQRKSLLRNNCDGTFTDVTAASGLARPATSTQTAVWTDIDNDGCVDLFVGNEDAPAQLFRNRGDGTFEDVAAAAGVDRHGLHARRVAAGDYDNDGWPGPLRLQPAAARTSSIATTATGTFTEVGAGGRRARRRSRLPDLVLRLRQRRLGRSVRQQLLPVGRGNARSYCGLPHNAQHDEALPQPGRRQLSRT